MSLEAAQKFLERVEREESLRTQLYISRPATLEQLLQFAHGKGFVLQAESLKSALNTFKPKLKAGSIEPLKQFLGEG